MILVLLALAASGAEEEALLEKELKAEILDVVHESAAQWSKGSIEGFMGAYWKSPDFRWVNDSEVIFGWQNVLDFWLKAYPDTAVMSHLVFSNLDITILNHEYALVFGAWTAEKEKGSIHGMVTLLLRRFDEGWRIVHDHSSG